MFTRILIANRGEIAARIIRTARAMGVETVAVYSNADAGALHVKMADQAVHIGPAAATESYLNGARIIAAALESGAQAIHPGYGFLSENPGFVEAVDAAGLTFIGPSATAIRAMGLKDRAKVLMHEAGVPVVPGYHGTRQEDDFLAGEADQIGYPVLIKAVAGGGGKGMRRVDRAQDFAAALLSARREAGAAFGNQDMLIEKYILCPRHIEIQVFGDGTNAVHLFERDCSLQRRHQKVIEEAPAPGMTAQMRRAMGDAAVRAARAIGYRGAGTIEFIVDGSGSLSPERFWFMEMNTRLQVEHPVTEAVTGIDLVEWQLQVASGSPLPLTQEQITLTGHAVEARVYAEDPANGFLPVTGTLAHVDFPPFLRADTGIRAGDAISPHYDPMIAKLIAHGPTREAALAGLARGIGATRLAGSVTNLGFLSRLLASPGFAAGHVDTGLIERELENLTARPVPSPQAVALAAVAALDLPRPGADGFHLWSPLGWTARLDHALENFAPSVSQPRPGEFHVTGTGADTPVILTHVTPGDPHWHYTCDGIRRAVVLAVAPDRITLTEAGQPMVFAIPDPLDVAGQDAAADGLIAPMPGLVRSVTAAPGQSVQAGQVLMVLEAMKMEHSLRASRDGVVAHVRVAEGAQVAAGDALLELEPLDD